MSSPNDLSMRALQKAHQVRQQNNIALNRAFCVYDLAEELGIIVRFVGAASLEGMYTNANPAVAIISSLRPAGRKAFTCAHEIGHHVFGHGTHIVDLVMEDGDSRQQRKKFEPDEFLVDRFASALLMPKTAVNFAFSVRGWIPASCTPMQVYTVAGWLGVGYQTLIHQMQYSLKIISADQAALLRKASLPKIRAGLLNEEIKIDSATGIVIVDGHWMPDRPVDIQAGDLIRLPSGIVTDKPYVEVIHQTGTHTIVSGLTPGVGRLINPETGWTAKVRVSRRNFVGLSKFRHLEEVEDE